MVFACKPHPMCKLRPMSQMWPVFNQLLETSRRGVWGVVTPPPPPHILHLSAFPQISSLSSHLKKIKNLWRRKCVRRAIFRNVEVRVEGRFVPFNPYFVCNTAIGSLCDDFYRKSYDFSIKNR